MIGHAEREVMPDRIITEVILIERPKASKEKTLEYLENRMITVLNQNGIGSESITVVNAYLAEQERLFAKNGGIRRKKYSITLKSGEEINLLMSLLREMEVYDWEIIKMEYTNASDLKRDLIKEAVLDAALKADMALSATESKRGDLLLISQNSFELYPPLSMTTNEVMMIANKRNYEFNYERSLQLEPIKFEVNYSVIWAIEKK